MEIIAMYCEKNMSTTEISKATGVNVSAIRSALLEAGVLRSRADAIRMAAEAGKLGSGMRGKKRVFSIEWKLKIAAARLAHGEAHAKNVSLKPSGYVEFTRGENKGRSVHVVLMEQKIGRRLYANEVVHHIDHNRSNNHIDNLMLMTRAEHSSLHAKENYQPRKRDSHGKFK